MATQFESSDGSLVAGEAPNARDVVRRAYVRPAPRVVLCFTCGDDLPAHREARRECRKCEGDRCED